MVQSAGKGKEDVRSVNAEQFCSDAELLIFSNSNKLFFFKFSNCSRQQH